MVMEKEHASIWSKLRFLGEEENFFVTLGIYPEAISSSLINN